MVNSAGDFGFSVALVGCGPRGLIVLERFVHRLHTHSMHGTVHVIEPGRLGVGIHNPKQPDYLLLNTIAAQVTTFVDAAMVPGGGVAGPSLYEWSACRGILVPDSIGACQPVQPTHHVPRALLGEYLAWSAEKIISAAESNLRIVHHRSQAIDVFPDDTGRRETVILESGESLDVDYVILTVGHTGAHLPAPPDPAADPRYWIADPYPLPDAVSAVPPGATIGVLGAGLTAMDVLAALTVGRGGRFEATGDRLRYQSSGREPSIVLASRSGLPARARPKSPAGMHFHPAVYFTSRQLEKVRDNRPDRRLNFKQDVLPMIQHEMWHRFKTMSTVTVEDAEELLATINDMLGIGVPQEALSTSQTYAQWYIHRVKRDLRHAKLGLENSPLKFALETLRDYREQLRQVVDEPGLNVDSLEHFFGRFASAINRAVIGPQRERNDELLALLDRGTVRLAPGPAPHISWHQDKEHWILSSTRLATPETYKVDYFVAALSPTPTVELSNNPVIRALVRHKRIRAKVIGKSSIGADLTRDGQPLGQHGEVQRTLFILGPLAEGSSYYNHYVASPGVPSRAVADADLVVESITNVAHPVTVAGTSHAFG